MKDLFRKFRRNIDGSLAVMWSFSLLGILIACSAAIDINTAYQSKSHIQDATDMAALAGAAAFENTAEREQIAYDVLTSNFKAMTKNYQAIEDYDIVFDNAAKTVKVDLETTVNTNLLPVVGMPTLAIKASSTAISAESTSSNGCLTVLDPNTNNALYIQGNVSVSGDCDVEVSSTHAQSVRISGNSSVRYDKICNAGGSSVTGNVVVNAMPTDGCTVSGDPLASLSPPEPSVPAEGACDYNNYSAWGGISITLNPGVYCGGLTVGGTIWVTFNPGTYIIKDGPANISGSMLVRFMGGEMIFKNSAVSITGNSYFRFYGDKMVVQDGSLNTSGNVSFIFFNPVEILVDDSPFNIKGNSTFRADNIFIYFKGENASFDTRGDVWVIMNAPTTGPYANILIYQDPSIMTPQNAYFQGSAYYLFTGHIYIPSWYANLQSSVSFISSGGHIVARTASIQGNSNVILKAGESAAVTSSVRLIN